MRIYIVLLVQQKQAKYGKRLNVYRTLCATCLHHNFITQNNETVSMESSSVHY